jgi:hypothetical protein
MKFSKTKAWLLSAAMAAGVAGFAPTASARDREENVRYDDLPRDVRRSVDEQRGRREVRTVQLVERDGREFYRVTIDDKGRGDTELRFNRDGKLLSSDSTGDTVRRDRDRNDNDLGEEREVRFATLPREVQRVMEQERGNRELKAVYKVDRDNRTFYRGIINERNGDRMIRVSEAGKILGDEDIREVRTASGRWEPDRSDRSGGVRRSTNDSDGERIAFDRLPGEVKTALGREAGSDRIREVVQYQRRGQTMYRAEVTSGDRTRLVRVNENGRIVSEQDDTEPGRENVNFRDLPGDVKSAIGAELNADQIERVTQITRDGRTYYRAVDRSGKSITVDERGRADRR